MKWKDISGQRFGRYMVLGRGDSDRHGNAMWRCLCDCGTEKVVMGRALRIGVTTSCGCANKEILRNQKTHGASGTSDYKAWFGILQRCDNEHHEKWHRYGARGITVCDRWRSYENFLADMGPRPHGMTIDRIDNNGNYEPSNCRWADQKTQGNNRGNNRMFDIGGVEMTLSQACEAYGINKATVRGRLSFGWETDRAFKTPVATSKENHA